MAKRLSEIVAALVEQAIAEFDVLGTDKDQMEWEVLPFIGVDGSVHWSVGVGLPVHVTGDTEMPFAIISDPHDRQEIARTVRALYLRAAEDAAQKTAQANAAANGHRESPGGLIIP